MATGSTDRRTTEKKRAVQAVKKAKRDAAIAKIQVIAPILDVSRLRAVPCRITVVELKLQLDWHRANGKSSKIPMKKLLKKKQEMLKALIDVVEGYNKQDVVTEVEDGDNSFEHFSFDDSDKDRS
jgi:hypothetical protein